MLKDLIVSMLGEPFYLNIIKLKDDKRWFPCFDNRFVGSTYRLNAVEMRRKWLVCLQKVGNPDWRAKDLKTVKIISYKG